MATLMSLLPITVMVQCYGPADAATHQLITSQHHHNPWKAHRLLENPNLGSLTVKHPHCYIITSTPSINQQEKSPNQTKHNLHCLRAHNASSRHLLPPPSNPLPLTHRTCSPFTSQSRRHLRRRRSAKRPPALSQSSSSRSPSAEASDPKSEFCE